MNFKNQMPDTDIQNIENLHRFRHGAMAATFEVFIVHRDAVYASQAAQAAFDELDRIETNLSRFIENSDVSRINSLSKSQPLQIGLSTFECLQISVDMCRQTNGAFDITFGSLHKGNNLPQLDEANHTIELLDDGIKIDLGAIGKGYAVDKMGQLLAEWGIDTTMISAGQSTILPIGVPAELTGWPVTISDPTDYSQVLTNLHLANQAISASGLRKGPHITNPRSGKPAKGKLACWATAKTAAVADALSTAFMVMSNDEIQAFCEMHTDTSALLIRPDKKTELIRLGRWGEIEKV
ncbi:MAG: FAD:protein FMN transferase [Sedimentisphaerales bacterium]